jgi:hypothetical protein
LSSFDKIAIRDKIDDLLGKGIDLDQAVIFESDSFGGESGAECASLLDRISKQAMASAEKIREARKLVLELT